MCVRRSSTGQYRVFRQIDNLRVCRNLHRIGRAHGNNFFFFNEDDLVTEKLARLAVKLMTGALCRREKTKSLPGLLRT